jgi:hypothetical protein
MRNNGGVADDGHGTQDPTLVRRMQRLDVVRSVPLGVLMPLESSLLIAIALNHYGTANWVKGAIAAAGGVGLLATPLITSLARRAAMPVMRVAAAGAVLVAAGLAFGAVSWLPAFVIGSMVAVAAMNMTIPLFTVVYQRNYPERERGRRVGRAMSVRVAVSLVAGFAIGALIDADLVWLVMLGAALAAAGMTVVVARIPSDPLQSVPGVADGAWPHFHLLAEDRQLRMTLISWMFMGFGNLMLLPLRVEYLGNPAYGIDASTSTIALLTVVVPSVTRIVTMPVFARVFDRMEFFSARILVNVFFAAYIAAFFTGTTTLGLVAGSVLFGIGAAGGDLMWSLWVTKFAPPGRTADYMSLHTFFTGVRAFFAPLVGFLLIGNVSLSVLAVASAALIVVASLTLLPEVRANRAAIARRVATAP